MIIKSKTELKKIIDQAKNAGKKTLVKKGVSDLIHPGHVFALSQFKKQADIVIILIQSDEFTAQKKGKSRPILHQKQRAEVVDGLKAVDYVFLDKSNSREDYIKFLNYLKPDILAVTKGDLQKAKEYQSPFWKLKEFPDKKMPGYSTTAIIDLVILKNKLY
jgi:cytidyltransferase-like protein